MLKQGKSKRLRTGKLCSINEKESQKSLSEFCGKWKDQRDADEIISEIYADREKNCRSDRFSL